MNTVAEAAAIVQWHDSTWRGTVQRISDMAQARLPEGPAWPHLLKPPPTPKAGAGDFCAQIV